VTAGPFDPPARIDWIPASDLADDKPGRLGLTVLPGKRGPSVRYPGLVYRGDLGQELRAMADAGVACLVLLVDDGELARWGDTSIVERGRAAGVTVRRHPMPDGAAPRDERAMEGILEWISEGRALGDVAVACMGGVGRTGTVVACALVAAGWDPELAIARVRAVRHPLAVETDAQLGFVRKFHHHRRGRAAKVAP
jgi:protein-tyrosine phosphatase